MYRRIAMMKQLPAVGKTIPGKCNSMKHFVAITGCRHHCIKISSLNIKISFMFKAEGIYRLLPQNLIITASNTSDIEGLNGTACRSQEHKMASKPTL